MKRIASLSLLILFMLNAAFHFLVISQIIPYSIVWGGRLKSVSEMIQFELVSIILNALFLFFMLIVHGTIKIKLHPIFEKTVLLLMFGLFSINTLGNMLAKSTMETLIFTPITLISAVFCFILVYKKQVEK